MLGNGEWHADLTPAWDAVYQTAPHIIRHVIGEVEDEHLTLSEVIGAFHAAAVATASALRPELLTEAFGHYPDGPYASRIEHGAALFTADVWAIWQDCIDAARERFAGWPVPVDFEVVREAVGVLGPQHVPPSLWPFIKDTSERMGAATSSVALAAIVACSAVIHESWLIQPKRRDWDWTQGARLWGAIVGRPGVLKSPIIRAATKPIVAMEAGGHRQWAEAMAQYKRDEKAWKDAGRPDPAPVAPRRVRYIVESTTVEALSEVLRDDGEARFSTPAGKILVLQDELGEFIGNIDKYQQGRSSGDRGSYLRLYDGGRWSVDRIQRGSFVVQSWSGCLLGGIQPEVIQKIAKETADDGLLQRILFDVPLPREGRGEDRAPDYPAMLAYRDLFPALAALRPARSGDPDGPVTVVCLHEQAHAAREDVDALLEAMARVETTSRVQSTLDKWSGVFGRLCLVFHLIEIAAANVQGNLGPPPGAVRPEIADRVRRYMRDILLPNLQRADAMIFHSVQTNHAGWIAGYILARKLDVVTARDIMQDYKQMKAPEEKRALYSVMESLALYGWVEPIEPANPTKPPNAWTVNPRVHVAYAQRAQEERERRDAIREAIERTAAERQAARAANHSEAGL
jgi:hypothetical protein